jgi:hypothetical protein
MPGIRGVFLGTVLALGAAAGVIGPGASHVRDGDVRPHLARDEHSRLPRLESHLRGTPPRPADAMERVDGEYGLWVDQRGDSLFVHWITRDSTAGFMRATVGNRVLVDARTAASEAHAVGLVAPRSANVVLDYGATDDPADTHRTVISMATGRQRPRAEISAVDSIFVVSDLHGELDRFTMLLRNAGLLDDRLRWTGGRTHLVVAGDIFDRGPDVIPLLWLLYRLEGEAQRARGNVHVLLGNHEIIGVPYWRLFDSRYALLGRWLASRNALLRIDRTLFAHGGVSADYVPYTVGTFADTLRTFIQHDLFRAWNDEGAVVQIAAGRHERWIDFFWGENSVFWYRDYVMRDDLSEVLGAVLTRMRSDFHVVGHTPVATIHSRYGGSLIAVNPAEFGTEGALLVRNGRAYDRYRYGLSGPPEPF